VRLETDAADIDESPRPGEAPDAMALRLARQKASAVAPAWPGCVVLGADTVVTLGSEVLGKPGDTAEARAFLERLRGRRHLVLTGIAVLVPTAAQHGPPPGPHQGPVERILEGVAFTGVWLRHFTSREIAAYIATGDPLDKAGGYAVQHRIFDPVARLEGSESNVIGLPLRLTRNLVFEAYSPRIASASSRNSRGT
jgi:septum formation protein